MVNPFTHHENAFPRPSTLKAIGLLITCLSTPGTAQQVEPLPFLQPFDLVVDPMDRLALINFEKDPDTLYIGFEPQVFNDPYNGGGHLVIGWRRDGRVDVYYDPALRPPDPKRYDIAGLGLAYLVPTDFAEARFEVAERGVDLGYQFRDLHGREIRLRIREGHPARRKPFGLLAPMGDAVETPSTMPLVLLHDFYFVRRRHTEVEVHIDAREHRLDRLPIRMDGRKMYFTRYSPDPLILTLNPAMDGPRGPEFLPSMTYVHMGRDSLILVMDSLSSGLACLERHHRQHQVNLCFDPPFPNLLQLPETYFREGRFVLQGHPSTGSLAGQYRVSRDGGTVFLELHPSEGWKPQPDKFSLRLLYGMAKIFKQWPSTYRWTAELEVLSEGEWPMRSRWIRQR